MYRNVRRHVVVRILVFFFFIYNKPQYCRTNFLGLALAVLAFRWCCSYTTDALAITYDE
jgi:hypothetical protein